MEFLSNQYLIENIQMLQDDVGTVWFKMNDIYKITKHKCGRSAVRSMSIDKKSLEELNPKHKDGVKNSRGKSAFINEIGLRKFLHSTRSPHTNELLQIFGIELITHKYECKESEVIRAILKAFNGETMTFQYGVVGYRIDLYFPEFNLAIECDEFNHSDRCPRDERIRTELITKELNCKWLRFNPDEKGFNVFDVINRIYLIIKK